MMLQILQNIPDNLSLEEQVAGSCNDISKADFGVDRQAIYSEIYFVSVVCLLPSKLRLQEHSKP